MEVTERHRQRAREWLSENVWPNTGRDQTRTLDPAIESLATLLAEVEGEKDRRIATLEAALREMATGGPHGKCLVCFVRSKHADDCELHAALSGSPSALKAMLVRAATDGLAEGCEDASTACNASPDEIHRWAEAIAERVLGGEP